MTSDRTLDARVEARWRRILDEQPDLEPAVELQRTLVRALVAAAHSVAARGSIPLPSIDVIAARLQAGLPALAGEVPPPASEVLGPLVAQFANDLGTGGAGDAAHRIGDAIRARRLDAHSIIAASLRRDTCAFRVAADQLSLAPDLLWLVGELAASPFAHALAEGVFAIEDGKVRASLAAWPHGYCPICGSWPAIGESGRTGRRLRCSFCSAAWQAARTACPYCEASGEHYAVVSVDPDRPDWLLELCSTCGGYLKVVRVSEPLDFPLAALEDLATSAVDRAALERGFHRPPIVERLGVEGSFAKPR